MSGESWHGLSWIIIVLRSPTIGFESGKFRLKFSIKVLPKNQQEFCKLRNTLPDGYKMIVNLIRLIASGNSLHTYIRSWPLQPTSLMLCAFILYVSDGTYSLTSAPHDRFLGNFS